MLVRVLLAAILAGVLGGAFATGAQSLRVTPLILEAETYENGGGQPHQHGAALGRAAYQIGMSTHSEEADEAEWAPQDGLERTFFTLLSNIIVGVGFALVLTAAILFVGQGISLKTGLVWGLAGFVTFVLAPAIGLPPELPGMPAADLGARQAWWLATVLATAGALWIVAFRREPIWIVAAIVLAAAPHIYGAPAPVEHESAVPAQLAAEFVIASVATAFAFWLFLGGVLGFLLERALRAEAAGAPKEAAA